MIRFGVQRMSIPASIRRINMGLRANKNMAAVDFPANSVRGFTP